MARERELLAEINALVRNRRYPEARVKLEQALKERPRAFQLLRRYADVLLKEGDTHRASSVIADLAALQPNHPQVRLLAAERHRLEGRTGEATAAYLEVLEAREDRYVRTRAIDGLLALKRYAEAERLIDEGLAMNPGDPYLLRRRGRLMAATSRPAEAAKAYAQASRAAPQSGKRDYVEALKLKLEAFEPEEQQREVEHLLKVGSHAENPFLLALAAELSTNLGKKDRARSFLEKARSVARDDPHALRAIGYQFNRLEDYGRVLDTLGPAFVNEPRDVVTQQVLLAAARKADAFPRLHTIFVLAYDRHPGFHKLAGLIKKVEKEVEKRQAGA